MEGVMMRGERSMALSVRDEGGNIRTETTRLPDKKPWYRKVPFLRGIVNLVISMIDGTKIIGKSADFLLEEVDDGNDGGWVMPIATVLGVVLALGLFVGIPTGVQAAFFALTKLDPSHYAWLKSLVEGVVKMAVLVGYMAGISHMKEIKRVFMYHGAEHKTINCYESELPLTVENVQKSSRYHDRCGTSFIVFVVVLSVVLMMVLDIVAAAVGFTAFIEIWWLRMLLKIALLPLTAGISYEVLMLLARTDFVLFRPLKWLGKQFQRLTTREPDDDMCQVAITSFNAVLQMDADPTIAEVRFPEPTTVAEFQQAVADSGLLQAVGMHDSQLRWLTRTVLGVTDKVYDNPATKVPYGWTLRLPDYVKRIKSGEPWQYVLHRAEFLDLPFYVDNNVLIPRQETELVCEHALKYIDKNTKVLDLCCGSGALGVTIAAKTGAKVTLADVSPEALKIAKQNAAANKVKCKFVLSNMFDDIDGEFDVIVCNPPYIETDVIPMLDKSVKNYEPHLALDGGEDGLRFYRILAEQAEDYLSPSGILVCEIGFNQGKTATALFDKRFETFVRQDYSDNDRILVCKLRNMH